MRLHKRHTKGTQKAHKRRTMCHIQLCTQYTIYSTVHTQKYIMHNIIYVDHNADFIQILYDIYNYRRIVFYVLYNTHVQSYIRIIYTIKYVTIVIM